MGHRVLEAAALLVATALASGCTQVASDYSLRLFPRTPDNQAPFDGDPALSVVIRDARGVEVLPADSLSLDGLGPLDGAWVGLLVEEPDGGGLRAWGEIGPLDLARGNQRRDRELLVSTFGEVGSLGTLPRSLFYGAAAVTSAGSVLLVGGSPSTGGAETSDRVLALDDLDQGDWVFGEIGTLPRAAVGLAATTVTRRGEERVLVTGGRSEWGTSGGNTPAAALLDPRTGEVVWDDPEGMVASRSEHVAIPMHNGKVLLAGGLIGGQNVWPASVPAEIFDPETLDTTPLDGLSTGFLGLAAASLGPDGVLLCGGGRLGAGDTLIASASCDRVTLTGDVVPADPLPRAVQLHAMAPAGDGRVLAMGGVGDAVVNEPGAEANDKVWLYDIDDDAWVSVGALEYPRAAHVAAPTGDGRVLILGGADAAGPLYNPPGAPVSCVELFDPGTRTLTTLPDCNSLGGGARMTAATHPDHGVFVLSGDGDRYGIVSLGPPALP